MQLSYELPGHSYYSSSCFSSHSHSQAPVSAFIYFFHFFSWCLLLEMEL